MKKSLCLFLYIIIPYVVYPQNICSNDILNGEEINTDNKINIYKDFDFSLIWTKTENEFIYGIIGDDYQRIQIKFITVIKNELNPREYLVFGKSKVKDNVCEFIGKITISQIQETKREHYGVDDEYKDKGIKTQGLLTAQYDFFENKTDNHSGFFNGELKSKWYLDKDNKIQYDDINMVSDGYFNNSFIGTWRMYNSSTEKICHWGDYRVPNINCDFDIGVGEFNVNEPYIKNGWLDIALKYKMPNGMIKGENNNIKVKEWWE